jgi:purine nucleosidase
MERAFGRLFRFGTVLGLVCAALRLVGVPAHARDTNFVIIDQDTTGPGGSGMNAVLALLQSRDVDVLGITVPSGDNWREAEVAHALRLLEIIGRTDIRVFPGAAFPLIRTKESTVQSEKVFGQVTYKGAWNDRVKQAWNEVPALEEGAPKTVAADEAAVSFLIRMAHEHPHQVTIFAGGPLTNIALAARADPYFASLVKKLVFMGASINPQTDAAEFVNRPRHEFNAWFDPEAFAIVLREAWPDIEITTVDVSLQTNINPVLKDLAGVDTTAAQYVKRYAHNNNSKGIAWDELAAVSILDPSVITTSKDVYMDVNLTPGPNYGDILIYSDRDKPNLPIRKVRVQVSADQNRLAKDLAELFSSETPRAEHKEGMPAEKP